jgi:glycosyltransferase involved in cell wall biosynthesis
VSVLLPVWNAAATLPECVESLLAQSLREIEVVAVDDGSTDGSREWLLARARAEPRLRVLARPHRGLVAALNPAARAARAPFLARMDADDVAHRERLRLQLSRLRRPSSARGCAFRGAAGAMPGCART